MYLFFDLCSYAKRKKGQETENVQQPMRQIIIVNMHDYKIKVLGFAKDL